MKVTSFPLSLLTPFSSSTSPIPSPVLKSASKLMTTRNSKSQSLFFKILIIFFIHSPHKKIIKVLFFLAISSIFFDRRMGQEVDADGLGESYKGYIFKITGGNDKDGFPMKQGIIVKKRIRLLLSKGHKCYRPRRTGERKRKSVRGCVVGPDIAALHLVLIKKGETPIEGLTNVQVPRRLGPKRLNRIRKLFGFDKKKDHISLIKKAIIRRKFKTAAGKERQKAPKIQRLVTPDRLRRKRIFKV